MELTQLKVEKQGRVINKICRDVSKVQDLVNNISKEFQLPNRIQPESSSIPTPDTTTQARRLANLTNSQHLDEQLREVNGFLKQIGEWLV